MALLTSSSTRVNGDTFSKTTTMAELPDNLLLILASSPDFYEFF